MAEPIQAQVDSLVVGLTRDYLSRRRAEPPTVGTSPDGWARVAIDGLGDVADITITAPEVPPRTAARLAAAVKSAWQAAAGARATSEAAQSDLADRPAYAALFEEQVDSRFTPPQQADRPADPARDRDEDFGNGVMISGTHRRTR